ncbi:unnamed protein product [Urochloa humidicola]
MATRVAAATLLPVVFSLLLLPRRGTCSDDYSAFVYAGCSQGRYAANSEYASGVDSVLTSVANSAPYAPYANFTAPSDASIAGLYQCRSDLPASICTGCVRSAISRLSSLCAWATGGAVQLRACFVRYGNDSFLGKQDTAVLTTTESTIRLPHKSRSFFDPVLKTPLASGPTARKLRRWLAAWWGGFSTGWWQHPVLKPTH